MNPYLRAGLAQSKRELGDRYLLAVPIKRRTRAMSATDLSRRWSQLTGRPYGSRGEK